MIRLTLAQMRRSVRRLAAAGVAIVVATAFITATLLGGNLITSTTTEAVTANLAGADAVARADSAPLDPGAVEELAALPETGDVEASLTFFGQVSADQASGGQGQDAGLITPAPTSTDLDPYDLRTGERPGAGEVVLTEATAGRLGLEVGDAVTVSTEVLTGEDEWTQRSAELTLSGVVTDPPAIVAPMAAILVERSLAEEWALEAGYATEDGTLGYDSVLMTATSGISPEALAEAAGDVLPGATVRTAAEEAELRTTELTGGTGVLVGFVLAFAAVAMFVAGIVIANTFQVLVAQRRHTLALLRCVGATRAQVRRSVLVEALLLGGLASLAGVAVGLGFGQATLWLLGRADLPIPTPEIISPSVWTFLLPVLTGILVTVLAALAPARAATRVAPVSALRPASDPASRRGGGRLRLAIAVLLGGSGAALLAGGVATATLDLAGEETSLFLALGLGVFGGMLSFAGLLVGAVFLVPRGVRLLGRAWARLVSRSRATVDLATANSVRNPRRTSATASALLIGVALVMMMATGAASARASLDDQLDTFYPLDLQVASGGQELAPGQIEAVRGADGVAAVAEVQSVPATLEAGGTRNEVEVQRLTGEMREMVRDPEQFPLIERGTVQVSGQVAQAHGIQDGDRVRLEGEGGDLELQAVVLEDSWEWIVRAGAWEVSALGPDQQTEAAPVTEVWARLAEDADAGRSVADVQDRLSEASVGTVPYVLGAAAERAAFEQVIDTLLAVIVGLLGVAVVIAVIGVANTLALSVIERRHEHALLRAVGMTRGQLRGSLVVEGVLVALVGTVVGVAVGLVYGWAGTATVLGGSGSVTLAVPWAYLAACAGGAVLAGLLASVLPARSAAKTPPVAALAA